jgi:hypothetical protein
LKRIDPNIECVPPLSVQLMVHSIQDRGTTSVISLLLTHGSDDTVFRREVPRIGRSWEFGLLHQAFKEKLNATLLALGGQDGAAVVDLNADRKKPVNGGSCLFYIAEKRLRVDQVPWNEL